MIKLCFRKSSSYPEGNFGGNQLLDSSIGLSPLYPHLTKKFARYHRYEPPPEFPLASPYAGIVHHLSGPNICAPTQIFHTPCGGSKSVDGACTQRKFLFFCASHLFTFISHYVLVFPHHNTRTYVRLLGPCFKTGRLRPFFAISHLLRAFWNNQSILHLKCTISWEIMRQIERRNPTLEHKEKW